MEKKAVIDLLIGHSSVQGAVRRPKERERGEGNPLGISNPHDNMK